VGKNFCKNVLNIITAC